ncbi:hypothetical protein NDU88_005379 [Pleurodeles waltl]|uniref:Uncharacterized protein n=1 Tax=Pleurodeles waltl TaxID=8319 RepID=A0AAV7MY68_PLEWA|nr:hypothetical protein NDU88_005379 [Pleurodeles waltl]
MGAPRHDQLLSGNGARINYEADIGVSVRRLMTPQPIRSEDGRDVRGRRGGKAEARTKRGVVAGRLLVGLISCGKNKRY